MMMIKRLVQTAASRKQTTNAITNFSFKHSMTIKKFNADVVQYKFSKRIGSQKSTQTTTFSKSPLINQEQFSLDLTKNNSDETFPELNELKNYFLSQENEEIDNYEDLFDEEGGLTQFDLNEGGESDFSEEFEKAIQNSNKNTNNSKKCNEKSLFDQKFGSSNMSRSLLQKGGIFNNNNSNSTNNDTQQTQESPEESSEKRGLMYLRKNKNHPTFLEKKFGLNISSDPRERQADLQRFVLKALQLLNAKQIQHFIQIIEYFKSKLTSHNFKKSQNVHEDFFMRQVFKLFENNQAEELMDHFLKCDLIDININLFTNNVADYEKSYEIKNKHKQFDAFSKQSQPNGSHFLLNELAEKYNNLDYQKYSSLQTDDQIEDQIDEIDIDSYDRNSTSFQKFYTPSINNNNDSTLQNKSIKNEGINNNQNEQTLSQQNIKTQNQKIDQNDQKHRGFEEFKNDVLQGDAPSDKEQQLFQKVTWYEYEKSGSKQKLDSQLFDSLSLSEQKNKLMNPINQKYDIFKSDNFVQTNLNTNLLEDEFFPSTAFQNEAMNLQQQNNGGFNDNFVLEPSLFSQQKIMQIGRQFENQFDHNLNLIDDINNDSIIPQTSLPSISNNAGQEAPNIKLLEKDFSELLNLETERAAISTKKINRIHNNKMVLKSNFDRDVQQHDEVIILNQEENLIPKKFEKSTYVYMYNLPYDLNEVPNYTNYIKNFVESTFGEVEEMNFFNYRDFFEIERIRQKEDLIPRGLRDSLQEQFINTNITSTTLNQNNQTTTEATTATATSAAAAKKKTYSNSKSTKLNPNNLTDEELLDYIYTNKKINPDFCQKSLKRTEKLLEKIQNKKEKKYNRSYAIIKFKQMKSKEACLSQDIRLFGINSFNEMFSFDDADYKKSLIISKIPWGISLQHLITKLNTLLKQAGLKHIKISTNNVNLKKVVTKYFFLLKLNNFKDSLDIVNAFKKHDFNIETQKLSCNHSYGSLKQNGQGYYEITDVSNQFKEAALLEKVNERKVFEIWNIYKNNSGYLNNYRQSLNEDSSNSDNIEIKEDELENYDELAQDAFNNQSITSKINNSAGFSKTSQYFQQKSLSDSTYLEFNESNNHDEHDPDLLFEELSNKNKK